jgi:Domain of unknown function (DUF4405)
MKLIKYFINDAIILLVFILVEEPRLTGFVFHEWLGVGLAGLVLIHLLLHWKWVVHNTLTFFRHLFHNAFFQFILDVLLLLDFCLVTVSGLMISRNILYLFGIYIFHNRMWGSVHSLSASAALLLVGLHLVLHWKWVVNTAKRIFKVPAISLNGKTAQVATAPVKINKN